MTLIWKDVSSYSRDDKVRTPFAWEARAAGIRIIITKGHIHHPGEWVFSYYGLMNHTFNVTRDLADVEAAKADAASRLRVILTKVLEALE